MKKYRINEHDPLHDLWLLEKKGLFFWSVVSIGSKKDIEEFLKQQNQEKKMKTKKGIMARITKIEKDYAHVLTGSLATIQTNAPRALMQISAETSLRELYWVLGEEYKSKLVGIN